MNELSNRWIVVSGDKGPAPQPHRHLTEESATKEARRLAIVNPDDVFTVYRSVKRVSAPRVVVEDFPDPADPPF